MSKRVEVIIKALDHISKPITIDRKDMRLFGILLSRHLQSFDVDLHPDGAWLALVDAYAEYTMIKEKIENPTPENVFSEEYLEELRNKKWL